ncbi:MAG: hypothetical protein HY518_02255 [Candidatus Aenigmarchaeota archaeon]|nr:hypothetical protein [Candidatus Aenigmarchaeota archaeon]
MALEDPAAILGALPQLIQTLPLLLQTIQLFSYMVILWFFGSIITSAYKGHLHPLAKFFVRVFFGLISLMIGVTIGSLLPFDNELLKVIQADIFIGGLIAALLISSAFYLFSYRIPSISSGEVGKRIRSLEGKIARLESILEREKISKPIAEADAKSYAAASLTDYKTDAAEQSGDTWKVTMRKGEKEATVLVDAYTGSVVKTVKHKTRIGEVFSDPLKIAGIVILAVLVVFGVFTFRGFPDFGSDVYSLIDITPSQLEGLAGMFSANETVAGCVNTNLLLFQYNDAIVRGTLPPYTNGTLQSAIENQSGFNVIRMYSVTHQSQPFILAVTSGGVCSSTPETFCGCSTISG